MMDGNYELTQLGMAHVMQFLVDEGHLELGKVDPETYSPPEVARVARDAADAYFAVDRPVTQDKVVEFFTIYCFREQMNEIVRIASDLRENASKNGPPARPS